MRDQRTRRDRFDKADEAFKKACADVNDSYAVWADACDRLMRIGKERLAAWEDLVGPLPEAGGATQREGERDETSSR